MSFGFAIGDFVALGKLAWGLYKQCKGASAEFAEICNEVLSIHTALRELEDEAQNEDSILNRAGKGRQKELNNIVQNCTQILRQLESLVTRYRSLGTSQKKVWDRIKFGDEGIQVIRNQLVLHTSTLTLFLTSLGTGSLGRIEKKLDDIAAEIRAGHHEPSVMTAVADDTASSGNEAWRLLSTELAENFSRQEIEAYRDEIKEYIRQLMSKGALEERAISVHSEDAATQRSMSGPSTPPSPVIEEQRGKRWPPQTTAISESESEDSDSEGRALHSKRPSDTEHSFTPINEPSKSRKATSQSSTKVLRPRSDPAPAQSSNGKGREEARWGTRSTIGIEIGDEHCRIAAYDFTRQMPVVVTDDSGCEYIPTCVAFTEGEILVGNDARAQASKSPENTFSGFTCLLGGSGDFWANHELVYKQAECPSLRKRGGGTVVFVPSRRRHYTLVELTAILLSRCRRLAEAYCLTDIAAVCITISSTWNCAKFRALAEAAEIAGLDCAKIVPNPIARAFEYATQDLQWTYRAIVPIIIIDVGARGFEVSLVNICSGPGNRQSLLLFYRFTKNYGVSIDGSILSIDEKYSQDLEEELGSVWPDFSMQIRNLCLFTGTLSLLPSMQSMIEQHISQNTPSNSTHIIPISNALANAAKGAAVLALWRIDIEDKFLSYTLTTR